MGDEIKVEVTVPPVATEQQAPVVLTPQAGTEPGSSGSDSTVAVMVGELRATVEQLTEQVRSALAKSEEAAATAMRAAERVTQLETEPETELDNSGGVVDVLPVPAVAVPGEQQAPKETRPSRGFWAAVLGIR